MCPSSLSSRLLFGTAPTTPKTSTPNRTEAALTRSSSATASTNVLASTGSKKPELGGLGRRSKMVVVAGRDLIVAVGSELRITSLNQAKARAQQERRQPNDTRHDAGDYKVLHTPLIKFEIQQLVLNPTNKFLAVVGAHSIAVVVLPRKGWSSTVGPTVECRSLLVGHYYHGLSGSPLVSQILWHPWGTNSSSLLVLTIDSVVREYDISTDVEEPTQTLSFVNDLQRQQASRSTPVKRSGGVGAFSAEDRNAKKAVAMCVGGGKADWGPLTLFGLMRNGDVVAICPFLPKKASVPASYIHALSSFVSTKVDYLNVTETTSESMPLTLSTSTPTKPASSSAAPHLSSLYARQLHFVHQLVRQASRASSSSSMLGSEGMDIDLTAEEAQKDHIVNLTAPRFGAGIATPKVQGPFLMQPEPIDLDHGEYCDLESLATDLMYLHYEPQDRLRGEGDEVKIGIGVIGVAFQDGKVDLCLEVEKIEARWDDAQVRTRGKDEEEGADELPSLCVYETIDLGLVRELEGQQSRASMALEGGWVSFIKDPLYVDTIYLQHPLGSHCLVLSRWLDNLVDTLNPSSETTQEDEEKQAHEMDKAVRASELSQVVWIVKTVNPIAADASMDSTTTDSTPLSVPVVGVDLINDVYLGYTMLLVTSSLQLVAIELSLRVDSSLLPSTTLASSPHGGKGLSNEPPPYLSLLEAPFETPSILASSSKPVLPHQVVPKSLANKGALETVTPDSLRFIGKSVEALRTRLGDLVDASDQVQNRIELQLAELGRQLNKVHELRKITAGGLIKATSGANGGGDDDERLLKDRIGKVKERQKELLKRTDRILQGLMDRHAPLVSTFERKWFDELKRLEGEIKGGEEGDGDRPGLETRVERLVEKVDMLKPGLEEMKKKEVEAKGGAGSYGGAVLGVTQLHKVEEKLAEEAGLIMEARKKVEKLSQALGAISLA
ncbi:BQ2448_4270 [Microbotryum intermedium]|uniref:BQ2448_4270 protein n=1 Tax=Microbotryum intermedium TaxID=269621 RepID=A0A238FL44_9BASI|nr:BQ2448_4270 [Microbotryum intermedium]